nr:hypothetical protein [Tanacetum cinerariifolium]
MISKEKNDSETKIEKFENESQSLDKLIGSQITNKSKRGLGYVSYNVVPHPYTGRFLPPRIELSHTGLPDFTKPSVESYGVKPIEVDSEGDDEVESPLEIERKTIKPSLDKVEVGIPKQNDKSAKRPVKYAEMLGENYIRGKGWSLMEGTLHLGDELKVMCDKKNNVLFANTKCFVLSPDFKLADESHVLLKVPKKNNMYIVDMKNIVPKKDLTCLVAKAMNDESMLWHRRLGHINFKNINELVKENLVRGLPLKHFENDQTYVACLKGKRHKVSFKSKIQNSITQPLFVLHMDLFGPTFNRVLVVKPHFKTPYELLRGRTLALSFMRPFGCHVTILNTLDHLGKFDGKSAEGFFVGYSTNIDGPKWLFDIDALTESMNYVPVITGTNSNDFAEKGASFDVGQSSMETGPSQDYILMPLWNNGSLFNTFSKDLDGDNKDNDGPCKESKIDNQERPNAENSTKDVNTARPSINTASSNINTTSPKIDTVRQSDDFFGADNDMRSLDGVKVDISNISTTYHVSTTPNTRIYKDYFLDNVISDMQSGVQTRRMTVTINEQGFISAIYEEKTHKDLHTCLFACFLSQEEPKRIINALKDPTWVEAMQEELLQFHLQKVWTLVDFPRGKTAIEGIDYDEVFTPVARIEAIRLFFAYETFMGFVVYHMDVKSAFLYERIEEEVYVCQPPGFEDPDYPDKV